MLFNEDGIDLKNWKQAVENGEKASIQNFITKVNQLNLRNSIFVDITANYEVANVYSQFLKMSVGVVTCNKIACSSEYENYKI